MTLFQILTLLIASITAIVIIIQAAIALRSMKADHERRKKQATIEFVQKIRPLWLESRFQIEKKWGKNPLTENDIEEIYQDHDLLTLVRNLLGYFEHLSVGMNTGVYDKDILFRASGSFLIGIHYRLKGFIERARNNGAKTAYIEFSDLVSEFEERKRLKPNELGNIKLS